MDMIIEIIFAIAMAILTGVFTVLFWLVRVQLAGNRERISTMEMRMQNLTDERGMLMRRTEMEAYTARTDTKIDDLRQTIKDDITELRRNEINQLYEIVRAQNDTLRETFSEGMIAMRTEFTNALNGVRKAMVAS
jgi:hypothetical protein